MGTAIRCYEPEFQNLNDLLALGAVLTSIGLAALIAGIVRLRRLGRNPFRRHARVQAGTGLAIGLTAASFSTTFATSVVVGCVSS